MEFAPKSAKLEGTITLSGPVGEVFELFSPLGEKAWVPGWEPEILHPGGAVWEEGMIFRTKEESGDAVWVVTRLDREKHEVEYHRVEAGRYVARVAVRCRAAAERATEASTEYEFVGLSERGNEEIAAMTGEGYAEKMSRWTRWINEYLDGRTG